MKKKKLCPNEYKCAACGGVYHRAWSEKEAQAECAETFGVHPAGKPGFVQICDDCYQRMHPRKHPEMVDKARKILAKRFPRG